MSRRSLPGAPTAVLFAVVMLSSRTAPAQALDSGDSTAASPFGMAMHDQRIYAHALVDELEGRFGDSSVPFRWDGEAWIGTDSNRLWLKSEGFAVDGAVEEAQHEVLYDRPLTPYFDLQGGLRYDLDSLAGRGWAAVGIEGLAPEFFAVSATVYASDAAHFAGRLLVSYDALLTQRLILQPLMELNLYTRADPARNVAAGASDLELGFRLRYEITRKFAPYLGAVYQRSHHPVPVDMTHAAEFSDGWRLAAGVRAWL